MSADYGRIQRYEVFRDRTPLWRVFLGRLAPPLFPVVRHPSVERCDGVLGCTKKLKGCIWSGWTAWHSSWKPVSASSCLRAIHHLIVMDVRMNRMKMMQPSKRMRLFPRTWRWSRTKAGHLATVNSCPADLRHSNRHSLGAYLHRLCSSKPMVLTVYKLIFLSEEISRWLTFRRYKFLLRLSFFW